MTPHVMLRAHIVNAPCTPRRYKVLAVICIACLLGSAGPLQASNVQEVQYSNGSIALSATLLVPDTEGSVPGVVIIHGSGDSDRENAWTSAYAQAFVDRGIAVLYPDKRGCGKSEGDWKEASFSDLAADASAALRFLVSQPNVDPLRSGVVGFSQGSYVASIVSEDPLCQFAVSVSGSVRSLSEQMMDEVTKEAIDAGNDPSDDDLRSLRWIYSATFAFANGQGEWNTIQDSIAVARLRSPFLASTLSSIPPSSDHWALKWVAHVGDFDPWPNWLATRKPVIFIYGGKDDNLNVQASLVRIMESSNEQLLRRSVLVFGGNGHTLYRTDAMDLIQRWILEGGED